MPIGFGTAVLYYNRWTEYENRTVGQNFRQVTAADLQKLKSGDAIWIDEDPIHPNGKVYGFVKNKFDRLEGERVYFQGGFTTIHRKIFIVDNEEALVALISADPKMTDVIGDSGRLASRMLNS